MSGVRQRYEQHRADVMQRASQMKEAIWNPVLESEGAGPDSPPRFIGSGEAIKDNLKRAVQGTVFEAAGEDAPMVARIQSNALRGYYAQYGEHPPAEMLAAAHKAVENLFAVTTPGNGGPGVFEAAGDALTSSEGVILRNHMVALVLPIMLKSIASRMTNPVVGDWNKAEMFMIRNVADSTFGDLTKGDRIDEKFNGQYSSMNQRYALAAPDGTEVGGAASTTPNYFDFDSNEAFYGGEGSDVQPFRKGSIRLFYQGRLVGKDDENGALTGSFTNDASAATTISGTVDYATGTVKPIFSVAPEATTAVHVGMEIDIEKSPGLIPTITHDMESKIITPYQRAIGGLTTLQALWLMRREYNIDLVNMNLSTLRNFLAGEQDRTILGDLYFHAQGSYSWNRTVPDGIPFYEHYVTVQHVLLEIDAALQDRTEGGNGLAGIVADTKSAIIFKSLAGIRPDAMQLAPNYRRDVQPHYVGRIFGMWDLYENPFAADYTCLCYARGRNAAQSGYLAASAIPPITFKHPVLTSLQYQQTLWAMDFREVNPWNGHDFFTNLSITTS